MIEATINSVMQKKHHHCIIDTPTPQKKPTIILIVEFSYEFQTLNTIIMGQRLYLLSPTLLVALRIC